MVRSAIVFVLFGLAFQVTNAQHLQSADCGRTYGCIKSDSSCTSSANCVFMVMFKVNGDMIDAQMSVRGKEWIAAGFNIVAQMAGTKGVVCKSVNGTITASAFENTGYVTPTFFNTTVSQVVTRNSQLLDGALICGFSVPYNGNAFFHNLNTSSTRFGVSARGIIAPGTDTILRHAQGDNIAIAIDITSLNTYYKSAATLTKPGYCVFVAMLFLVIQHLLQ